MMTNNTVNIELNHVWGEINFVPTSFLREGDNGNLFFEITINCKFPKYKKIAGDLIHMQLKGKEDYINSSILLNCNDKEDPDIIRLLVFEDCKSEVNVKII